MITPTQARTQTAPAHFHESVEHQQRRVITCSPRERRVHDTSHVEGAAESQEHRDKGGHDGRKVSSATERGLRAALLGNDQRSEDDNDRVEQRCRVLGGIRERQRDGARHKQQCRVATIPGRDDAPCGYRHQEQGHCVVCSERAEKLGRAEYCEQRRGEERCPAAE